MGEPGNTKAANTVCFEEVLLLQHWLLRVMTGNARGRKFAPSSTVKIFEEIYISNKTSEINRMTSSHTNHLRNEKIYVPLLCLK